MSDPTTVTIPASFQRAIDARGITQADIDAAVVHDPFHESEEDYQARASIQRENRERRWNERLPRRFRDASATDLDQAVSDQVGAWLKTPDALNLNLVGNVGAGKTHTAYAVGNYLVSRGDWVEAWTVHDLLQALRPDGDNRSGARAELAHVLLLDDLGAGKASDWAVDTITSLYDSRTRHMRRTILTTNLSSEEIERDWGTRFLDRMTEGSVTIVFTGESRRRPAW